MRQASISTLPLFEYIRYKSGYCGNPAVRIVTGCHLSFSGQKVPNDQPSSYDRPSCDN